MNPAERPAPAQEDLEQFIGLADRIILFAVNHGAGESIANGAKLISAEFASRRAAQAERQVAGAQLDEAESLLASTTDLLNSWAREMGVQEARNEEGIRELVDRLWSELSKRLFALPAERVSAEELANRIDAYLQGGGLFNPEMAIHNNVRDLLIDCREALRPTQQKGGE